MLDWMLRHIGGLGDWFLVFLAVFACVFLFQFMVNFFKDPTDEPEE